ncbi:MAG: hypothetical protein Q7S44_01845 [bacterium]|nr:hypothetical protein [bacterium]
MKKILNFLETADKFSLYPALTSFFTLVIIGSTFAMLYNHLPPKLPLFYSLTWGQSQLADKSQFLLLPIILVLLNLLNLFLAFQLHSSQVVLKRMLWGSVVLIDAIILIGALRVLFLFV